MFSILSSRNNIAASRIRQAASCKNSGVATLLVLFQFRFVCVVPVLHAFSYEEGYGVLV